MPTASQRDAGQRQENRVGRQNVSRFRRFYLEVLFRAIKRAMQGNAVGWGRIEPRVAAQAPS